MADWKIVFLPHFVNAEAENISMHIDSDADIPVPVLPSTATEGSKPRTAVVSSLQVGDSAYVGEFVHEITEIGLV